MMRQRAKYLMIAVAAGAVMGACDDPFAAFLADVPTIPTEATLFDLTTGRLEDPPAYDIILETTVRVDQSSQWDFLFQIDAGGPQFVPFSAATDSTSDSGLVRASASFEATLNAPSEGYTIAQPLSISVGDVFVVRSRADRTLACSRFAKIEILEIDVVAGTVMFRLLGNPNCGDTVLEPGMHGSF